MSWTDDVAPAGPELEKASAVIVIALDGVRWQEVFRGCAPELSREPRCREQHPMPNLSRLYNEAGAAFGAPGHSYFGVAGPSYLSMPGYRQLFTGRRQVDCVSNECGRVEVPTVAEAVAARYGDGQAVVFSSWPGVGEAAARDPGQVTISSGSATPTPEYRADSETAKLALEHAQNHVVRFLFVGLGDMDEVAHNADYDAYLAALRRADEWILRFHELALEQTTRGTETTLFVTTDHGRADDCKEHEFVPSAGRTWLVVSGPSVRARGPVVGGPHELADLAPTVADLLGVALEGAQGEVLSELYSRRAKPVRVSLSW